MIKFTSENARGEIAGNVDQNSRKLTRPFIRPLVLEQRFMFDGAAVVDAVHTVDAAKPVDPSATQDASKAPVNDVAKQAGLGDSLVGGDKAVDVYGIVRPVTNPKEILFIDAGVQDKASLINGAKDGVEVVVLDPAGDPWQQMTDVIAQHQDLSAIYIVSHGVEGQLELGGQLYGNAEIQSESAQLAAWQSHLAQGADILIYGCDVGAGADGTTLISSVASLTHADVAASTDATGGDSVGGNWTLETQTGSIDATAFAPLDVLKLYDQLLAMPSSPPARSGDTAYFPDAVNVAQDSAVSTPVSFGLADVTYQSTSTVRGTHHLQYTVSSVPDFVTLWADDGSGNWVQIDTHRGSATLTEAQFHSLGYETSLSGYGSGSLQWTVKDVVGSGRDARVVGSLTQSLDITVNEVVASALPDGTVDLVLEDTMGLASDGGLLDIASLISGDTTGLLSNEHIDLTQAPSFELVLNGTGVQSGLYALNPDDPQALGAAILLVQTAPNVISGMVDGHADPYFVLTCNEEGCVTFTQLQAVCDNVSGDTTTNLSVLNTTLAGALSLRVTVNVIADPVCDTHHRDHHDSGASTATSRTLVRTYDLGNGVFEIQDSLPFADIISDDPLDPATNSLTVAASDDPEADATATLACSGFFHATENSTHGNDGGTYSDTYSFVLNEGNTGLVDAESGQAISLRINEETGQVEGYCHIDDEDVVDFTLSVDEDGCVTLNLSRAVTPSDPVGDNKLDGNSVTLADFYLVQLKLTETITDGDGDTSSSEATIDLSQLLVFKDNREISVSGGEYNENSPYAIFEVEANPGQLLTFDIPQADGANTAPEGEQNTTGISVFGGTEEAPVYNIKVSVDGGETWVDYDGTPIRAGEETVLVAVDISAENDKNAEPADVYEGVEKFKLIVNSGEETEKSDYSSIADDGTGDIVEKNPDGSSNEEVSVDDDRTLSVNSIDVNEASPYGVFTVEANAGETITLALNDGTVEGSTAVGGTVDQTKQGDGTVDYDSSFQYSYDGVHWTDYTGAFKVSAADPDAPHAVTKILVRTKIQNDIPLEVAEDFTLTVSYVDGDDHDDCEEDVRSETGTATIHDDGTGDWYAGDSKDPLDEPPPGKVLDDDSDIDGIDANSEYHTGQLGGSPTGDLNGDGIPDYQQSSVADLAWIYSTYFKQGLDNSLAISRPVISLTVDAAMGLDGAPADNTHAGDYQLKDIQVVPQSTYGGQPVQLDANGLPVYAPWDPIQFTVTGKSNVALNDVDLNRDGTQIVVTIDISRAGMNVGDFNGYLKYVSADAITAANLAEKPLKDLDGNVITKEGWYDFTQRKDANGNYVGDGARYITKDGKIVAIQLTLTDNAFGDNDMRTDVIFDPGMPILRVPPAIPVDPAKIPDNSGPALVLDPGNGPQFDYPPFDSTLYPIFGNANPKDSSVIERTNWNWEANRDLRTFDDYYTDQSQWRAVVIPGDQVSLRVFHGMGDQFGESGHHGQFIVPSDAFVHSQTSAWVGLIATQANGDELPPWMSLNRQTGVFSFDPPKSFRGEIKIKLTARDTTGREASTLFRFHVGDHKGDTRIKPASHGAGKLGFSEQLRDVSHQKLAKRGAHGYEGRAGKQG